MHRVRANVIYSLIVCTNYNHRAWTKWGVSRSDYYATATTNMEIERNWDKPINEWSEGTVVDYVVWVKDTYGEEEAKKLFAYAQGYRAVKDVMWEEPTLILTGNDRYVTGGWHDPRAIYGTIK